MSDIVDLPSRGLIPAAREAIAPYVELTKPRIVVLVLIATAVGFYLAHPAGVTSAGAVTLLHALLGTLLVGAGANALNQCIEAVHDAKMDRTANRPIPSGRLSSGRAWWFGVAAGISGVGYLALTTTAAAALVAAATLISYVALYTPLKRVTTLSLFVGAVPGALPPVIGWAAASGGVSLQCLLIFAIMYFWQLPHFLSIAWLYRGDYARAGFVVVPVVDRDGTRIDLEMITHSVALLFASLLPVLFLYHGAVYAVGAGLLGMAFLACGIVFIRHKTPTTARAHLLSSLVYLPVLLALMLIDAGVS
jgi:protoheme IX farnesyltransferase